jgi:hypothetical protein
MKFLLVEPTNDRQNTHVATRMLEATEGLRLLIERGCVALSVHIEGAKPVIWIQPPGEKLAGALVRRTASGRGVEYVRAAVLGACQVQWVELYRH